MRWRAWVSSRTRWERRAAALTLCLVLGTLVSLTLAWIKPVVTAYRRSGGVTYSRMSDALMVRADDGREFEATVIREPLRVAWMLDPKDWQLGPGSERLNYPRDGAKPWWIPWPKPGQGEGVSVDAYGFPFPAMQTTTDRHNSADWSTGIPKLATKMDWHGMWMLQVGSGATQVAYLPTQVFWAGFAADTGIFAAVCWGLLFGVRAARVRRWSRSGRCASCGYDRRGQQPDAKCPECGTLPTAR